jgi:hypothetical protein
VPKEPKVYGTPIGVAGGPSETPSTAKDRKVAKPATDQQVHEVVKAAKADPWREGRVAPPRTSSPKAAGPADEKTSDEPSGPIDALKNRGKRIDAAVDRATK